MTEHKQIVQRYMEAYARADHATVLACLSDDVEWAIPGHVSLSGKAAFEAEMRNPGFESKPEITVTRLVEEGDVIVAEGAVRTRTSAGEPLTILFCDVFVMRAGKIRQLISYLVPLPS